MSDNDRWRAQMLIKNDPALACAVAVEMDERMKKLSAEVYRVYRAVEMDERMKKLSAEVYRVYRSAMLEFAKLIQEAIADPPTPPDQEVRG